MSKSAVEPAKAKVGGQKRYFEAKEGETIGWSARVLDLSSQLRSTAQLTGLLTLLNSTMFSGGKYLGSNAWPHLVSVFRKPLGSLIGQTVSLKLTKDCNCRVSDTQNLQEC